MLMQPHLLRSHLTSSEILCEAMTVSVSTFFNDFALEEVVVTHLNQIGYQLAHRVVGVEPWQVSDSFDVDLIFTDHLSFTGERVVVIPAEALRWNREVFIEYLHRTLYPNPSSNSYTNSVNHRNHSGDVGADLLVIGSAAVRSDCETIVEVLIKMRLIDAREISISTFHDEDLALALMPTRRSREIERIMRIQDSMRALFLVKQSRAELAGAESFMVYQRRMHQSLNLGFLVVASTEGRSKRFINDAEVSLNPFPIFPVQINALRAISASGKMASTRTPSSLQLHRLRLKELAKWLGSTRGNKEQ
jgi:hypothetical protein